MFVRTTPSSVTSLLIEFLDALPWETLWKNSYSSLPNPATEYVISAGKIALQSLLDDAIIQTQQQLLQTYHCWGFVTPLLALNTDLPMLPWFELVDHRIHHYSVLEDLSSVALAFVGTEAELIESEIEEGCPAIPETQLVKTKNGQ